MSLFFTQRTSSREVRSRYGHLGMAYQYTVSGSPDHCVDLENSRHAVGTMQPRGFVSVQHPTMPRTLFSLQNPPLSQVTGGPTRQSLISHIFHRVEELLIWCTVRHLHGIAADCGHIIVSPLALPITRPSIGGGSCLRYPFIRTRRGTLSSWRHRSPIPRIGASLKPPGIRLCDHIAQGRQSKGECHALITPFIRRGGRPARSGRERQRRGRPLLI